MYWGQQARYGNNGCGCLAISALVVIGLILMVFASFVSLIFSAFAAAPLPMLLLIAAGAFGVSWWWRKNVRVTRWGRAWQAAPPQDPYVDAAWEAPRTPIAALEEKSPYTVLGVTPNASQEEIVTAYRQLAKQYHPDRVAHLGPEFQELAEVRMKEINQAYQELREGR